jgi:glycerophosphoryl diester phosphodiesterase
MPSNHPRIAHRGCSSAAPENTMAAFQKAIELGVEGIELDVHQSKDGELVVIHDATLSRTTSGRGYVNDLNWSELQQLDAGSWFEVEYASERLPKLEDVLNLLKGRSTVFIEIKQGRKPYPGIEERVMACIEKLNMQQHVFIHSF